MAGLTLVGEDGEGLVFLLVRIIARLLTGVEVVGVDFLGEGYEEEEEVEMGDV